MYARISYVNIYVFMYACVYNTVYVCMCVFMYVCDVALCVCICVCIHADTYTYVSMCTRRPIHVCFRLSAIYIYMIWIKWMYVCIYASCMYVCTWAKLAIQQSCNCPSLSTSIEACMQCHAYNRACRHTHAHMRRWADSHLITESITSKHAAAILELRRLQGCMWTRVRVRAVGENNPRAANEGAGIDLSADHRRSLCCLSFLPSVLPSSPRCFPFQCSTADDMDLPSHDGTG